MYCSNCGKELKEGSRFCPGCGMTLRECQDSEHFDETVIKSMTDSRKELNQSVESKVYKEQPVKAMIMEGIGFLFFFYLILVSRSDNYDDQRFLEKSGPVVFIIGLVFVTISFFMFRRFKKNNNLESIALAAYIISCLGMILMVVVGMFFALSIIIMIVGARSWSGI